MKIGIDISQMAYEKTGVANFLKNLVIHLVKNDKENEYILFFSSLRREFTLSNFDFQTDPTNVTLKKWKIPPTVLALLWNKLHILPIETFIGDIDIFISSDWTQPPTRKAKKATILYDLIVYTYPQETDAKIVSTQKSRLEWVKKECEIIFGISDATIKDAKDILKISPDRLYRMYPGGLL